MTETNIELPKGIKSGPTGANKSAGEAGRLSIINTIAKDGIQASNPGEALKNIAELAPIQSELSLVVTKQQKDVVGGLVKGGMSEQEAQALFDKAEKGILNKDEEKKIETAVDSLIIGQLEEAVEAEEAANQTFREALVQQLVKSGLTLPQAEAQAADIDEEINEDSKDLPKPLKAKFKELLTPKNLKKAAAAGGIFAVLFLVATLLKAAGGEK